MVAAEFQRLKKAVPAHELYVRSDTLTEPI